MSVRSILPLLVLVLAIDGSAPPSGTIAPPDTTGTIRGCLLRESTRSPEPIANVLVHGTRRGARVGEDGCFEITLVPPGRRTLLIARPCHAMIKCEIEVAAGPNDLGELLVSYPAPIGPVKIGSRAVVRPGDLAATLRLVSRRIRLGEAAQFEARILNRGQANAVLVRAADASDTWASPRVWIDITGPDDGFFAPLRPRYCENDGVTAADFERIAPGSEFDPWAGGSTSWNLIEGRFQEPGRYRATFHYDTTESDGRKWMSDQCGKCVMPTSLSDLLEQVPAVSLTASVEFDVVP